jgi:O-antigen/teichoic acid export membrane protein
LEASTGTNSIVKNYWLQDYKKYFDKYLLPVIAFGVPAIINLISLVFFTRNLSFENYGLLSLIWISVEFFAGILYGWTKMGMMRFYDKSLKSVLVSIQLMSVISVLLILSLLIFQFFNPNVGNYSLIPIVTIGLIVRGVAYYLQDYVRISNNSLLQYTLIAFLIGFCYYIPAIVYTFLNPETKATTIVSVQVLSLGLLCIFYISPSLYKMRQHLLKLKSKTYYNQFLKYSTPIIISTLAISIFTRVDRYLIENFIGLEALGIYSASYNLSNLAISSLFSVITISSYPKIIRHLNTNEKTAAQNLYHANSKIFYVLIPVFLAIAILLEEPLCRLMFGDKSIAIGKYFPAIVVAVYFFNLKVHHLDQKLQFLKKTKVLMMLSLLLGLGHLIFCYLTIKSWGIYGVAISSIVMSLLAILYIFFYAKKDFDAGLGKKYAILSIILFLIITTLIFRKFFIG